MSTQSAGDGAKKGVLTRLRSAVLGLVDMIGWQAALAAVLGLVLLVVGSFGGFKQATASAARELRVIEVGKPATVEPWTIELGTATTVSELKPILRAREGIRFIVVEVYLTNTSPRFINSGATGPAAALLRIDTKCLVNYSKPVESAKAQPAFYRVDDGQPAGAFQPGVRYRVVAVWEQSTAYPAPDTLALTVTSSEYRASTLDGAMMWFDKDVSAKATLSVRHT